jgi:hypothetical protein
MKKIIALNEIVEDQLQRFKIKDSGIIRDIKFDI